MVFVIFASTKMNGELDNTNCILSSMPYELLSGINENEDQFMGFYKLLDVVNNFFDESAKVSLAENSTLFDTLTGAKLQEEVKKVTTSITAFKTSVQSNVLYDLRFYHYKLREFLVLEVWVSSSYQTKVSELRIFAMLEYLICTAKGMVLNTINVCS